MISIQTQGREQYLDCSIIVLLILLQGCRVVVDSVNNLLERIWSSDFGEGHFGLRLFFNGAKALFEGINKKTII